MLCICTCIVFFRVKAYIDNGWSDKVYNPDVPLGDCSTNESVKFDSTVSPPTEGWKTIQSAFQSSDDVPRFSLSNVINYFVVRTASDGKAANDFKSINKSAENLFHCGHQGSATQPIPAMYDPRPTSMRTVDPIKLEQLRLDLLSVDHRCGILQQLVPSDKYLRHDHTYCSSTSVTQVRSDSDTADLNAQTGKWSVTDEEKLQVYLELTVTAERRLEIELLTRGQAETPLWYSVCAKRITGSKCGKILCQHTRTDALLKSVLYPTTLLNKPPPIQWGIHHEKLARNLYVQHMRNQGHINLSVEDCGFIVNLYEGWLGASPDGRVHDPSSDQPNGLLEIKCPYTKRAQTPQEAREDTAFYCTLENGKLKLKHNHAYYHQVQQQLYVSKDTFSWCDFCIYTTKGCLVTRISLDEKWVEENIPKLEAYFEECMLEEIILGCLKPSCYL